MQDYILKLTKIELYILRQLAAANREPALAKKLDTTLQHIINAEQKLLGYKPKLS